MEKQKNEEENLAGIDHSYSAQEDALGRFRPNTPPDHLAADDFARRHPQQQNPFIKLHHEEKFVNVEKDYSPMKKLRDTELDDMESDPEACVFASAAHPSNMDHKGR